MLADIERRRQLIASQGGQVTETVAVSGADVVGWIVAGSCRDADRTYPWQGEIYGCYVLPGGGATGSAGGCWTTPPTHCRKAAAWI